MKNVIIIGAGGHAKVIAEIVRKCGDRVLGFLDDGKQVGEAFFGAKILGKTADAENFENCEFIIGIGSNDVRKRLSAAKLKFYTAIHPSAVLAESVGIGEGTAVMPGAVINPDAEIGKHVIVNSGAVIEHDCIVDDFAHISPGAVVCGTVNIGESVWVGGGSIVKNNIKICKNTIIGVGAAVVKDITEPGVYVGVPATKIKNE